MKRKILYIQLSNMGRLYDNNEMVKSIKNRKKCLKQKMYNAKKDYFCNRITNSTNVIKTTWNLINKEVGNRKKSEIVTKLIKNNNTYSCPVIMCNLFNNHFINLVDNEILPILKNQNKNKVQLVDLRNEQPLEINYFKCKPVDCKEMDKIIMSFDNKYSTGYDDIPIPVIKQLKKHLIKPLVHLVNSSLISGIFPQKLKISKVIPLHKKGDVRLMSNYRPVSLLPVFSKIYEKLLFNRLIEFLEINNLLDGEQHGFRKGRSATTAAIDFIESIINAIEAGEKVGGLFMDLSKAFDSVSHNLLIKKLTKFKIKDPILSWIKSYLTNRQQYVELTYKSGNQILTKKSQLKNIRHGVPQGSILGPLLFLCYINGLPKVISGEKKLKCSFMQTMPVQKYVEDLSMN